MKPTALFLFNSSEYAPAPWLNSGMFHCVSVDYDHTDHSGDHRVVTTHENHFRVSLDLMADYPVARVLEAIDNLGLASPSFVFSFAPCTDLAVSGAAHFKRKLERDPQCQYKATSAAVMAEGFNCPYMVENPVSVLSTLWRKPNFTFNPCDYAGYCPTGEHPEFPEVIPEQDRYNKKTCIWSGNGAVEPAKDGMSPLLEVNPGHQKLGGKSARTKYIRSLTPRGFSEAVFVYNCTPALIHFATTIQRVA